MKFSVQRECTTHYATGPLLNKYYIDKLQTVTVTIFEKNSSNFKFQMDKINIANTLKI